MRFTNDENPCGDYLTTKMNSNTVIDRIHLKCDSIAESFVDGFTQNVLFSSALDEPHAYKKIKHLTIIHLKSKQIFL